MVNSYPAARQSAPRIHDYFIRHLEAVPAHPRGLVTIPPIEAIERMVDATFWASLRREEGYFPKISLAYMSPAQSVQPLHFERPLPLLPTVLAKVAPVVERAGIHLGVWHGADDLVVWGTTRSVPQYGFVLELAEPGLLVVKHRRGDSAGKYVNVAVLEGDQVKLVDERASNLPDCPDLLTTLLGFTSRSPWVGSMNVLVELAVSMRAHRRGGSLLVVPAGTDAWRESVVSPIAYAVSPAYGNLSALIRDGGAENQPHVWQAAMRETVDAIAGLTAVDGATVITDAYDLLAFGAKILRRRGSPPVERVAVTEPIEGGVATVVGPTQIGGTRHLSAAQFVHDQHEATAFVASQDGRFTVFVWSPCEAHVHAHRIEALLL